MRAWMKKCMALALCAALCLGLAACGENAAPSTASGANAPGFEGEEAPDYNLITGQPLAEGMAVGQRPVAVMVRAERAGWPQSGLAGADALVELATQGGQTALMALYANAATLPQVGPVGPLWDQHLQLAMAVDAVCVHIGGSVYAENLLNAKTYQDVDGEYVGTQSFVFMTERRDYGNEFSWYVNAEGLSTGMSTVGLDASKGSNVPFLRFAKAPFTPAGGDAPEVAFQFSEQCPVRLVYDEAGQKGMVETLQLVPAFSNIKLEPTDPLGKALKVYVDEGKTSPDCIVPADHWSKVGAAMQQYLAGKSTREQLAAKVLEYWKSKA